MGTTRSKVKLVMHIQNVERGTEQNRVLVNNQWLILVLGCRSCCLTPSRNCLVQETGAY
jgi:hypothetical protein